MGMGPVTAEGSITIILILANETIRARWPVFHRAHGTLRIFLFICTISRDFMH